MSNPQSGGPNQSFHERLNRVAEIRAPVEAAKGPVEVLPDWKDSISGKVGLVIALLFGVLAVLLVRIGRFHLMGTAMIGENADMTMAIETGAAITLSFLIFMLLPFKGYHFRLAQFAGVMVMISMMHNVVHSAPGLFGTMFSPEWAAEVTAVTEPNSLYLRGEVIPFAKPEKEEKKMPTVRRVG